MMAEPIKASRTAAWLVTSFAVLAYVTGGFADETDPILQYYWSRAAERAARLDPTSAGIDYSFTASSYAYQIGFGGRIIRTDSTVADLYYTGGKLDSQITLAGNSRRFERLDLSFPNVFEIAYHLNLFPNDTGEKELAIGLLADSAEDLLPDGLVMIDRTDFTPRRLYLCYPRKKGFKRFSRAFRFAVVDGYLFPDSIVEVGIRHGIFKLENYRLEIGISNIRPHP